MLEKIKIVNFRSFDDKTFIFKDGINIITGNNGVGKTNILEAIGVLFSNNTNKIPPYNLVNNSTKEFFLYGNYINELGISNTINYNFNKENNKKQVILNNKKSTKINYDNNILKTINFYPVHMNLFIMGPKYRRDFIDSVLKNTFSEYKKILKNYEEIVKSRNKILKNIQINKSTIDELNFWDNEFIKYAYLIYEYRYDFIDFVKQKIPETKIFINGNSNIDIEYISKINRKNIKDNLEKLTKDNLEKQIIIGKTSFGPHVDDFDIKVNNTSLLNYASRGEIKSIIIKLKLIECEYLEEKTNKKPIFLIDDILSELDSMHLELIIDKLKGYQLIISMINNNNNIKGNIIKL